MCGMGAGLCVVLMFLGSAMGIMTYACPILAGVVVAMVRQRLGRQDALVMWVAAGLLGLMLVPELEMAALFAGLYGWYAALHPDLERLPRWRRRLTKLVLFLAAYLVVYGLLYWLMGAEGLALSRLWEAALLLVTSVVVFGLYDRALCRIEPALGRWLDHLLPRH